MEKEIHPLLDKEKQEKAKVYEWTGRKIALWGMLVSAVFNLFFYFSGLSSGIANLHIFSSVFFVFLVYMFVYASLQEIIGLPLSYISGFVVEKKYGFSNQTRREWFKEHLKSFLVSLILSLIIFGALLYIFQKFGNLWWLVASCFMIFFSVILSAVYPVWIMPIFHKYETIEDDELKDSLRGILEKGGLKIAGFFREDTSRKTTKENAMLAGLGKTKRVILTDNIISNMKADEIRTVLAHEVGHYKWAHMPKMIFTGLFFNLFSFYVLHLTFTTLFPNFLGGVRANITLLPMFLLFLSLIDLAFLKMLQNALVRLFENQADDEALKLTEDACAFKKAMAGLANRNLSNAYPNFWVKLIYYSHPPIGERLERAERFNLDSQNLS
jgi:STE24 endopeptidase